MSALHIGQQVRVLWVKHAFNQHLIGAESFITCIDPEWFPDRVGFALALDHRAFSNGMWEASQLAPITPEGLESNEKIDALYEPSPVTA